MALRTALTPEFRPCGFAWSPPPCLCTAYSSMDDNQAAVRALQDHGFIILASTYYVSSLETEVFSQCIFRRKPILAQDVD